MNSQREQTLNIPYKVLTFLCEPENELYLPEFKGSTFRGILGRTLRQALCVLKTYKDCHLCPIYKTCYYAYIFETIPDPEKPLPFNFHKLTSLPHPFILEPPLLNQKILTVGEQFSLKIILVGTAIKYEPYFILALELASEHGVGKGNKKFKLQKYISTETQFILLNLSNPTGNNSSLKIALEFLTPLRIIYQGKLLRHLEFHILVRQLLRRITALYYFHCSNNLPELPVKDYIDMAQEIRVISSTLKWYDWERYSFRKKRRMMLGGLVGKIEFEGKLSPFLDLLKAGEILHCGKNTSFGLGKYQILNIGG